MVLWFFLGCVVGTLNMAARWWVVANLQPQGDGLLADAAIGGILWRTLLAGGLLAAGLAKGIMSGLMAFAGLEVARWVLILLIFRRTHVWKIDNPIIVGHRD